MRLRAIREYTGQSSCEHTPPKTATYYNVTFAREDGIVIADCNFHTKAEANAIVDAVNKRYDELGEPGDHCSEWWEDEHDTVPD